jgi:hypothetical protein
MVATEKSGRSTLTKLFKVKRGIFQIGESCVERWTLKHQYERYDGPE